MITFSYNDMSELYSAIRHRAEESRKWAEKTTFDEKMRGYYAEEAEHCERIQKKLEEMINKLVESDSLHQTFHMACRWMV